MESRGPVRLLPVRHSATLGPKQDKGHRLGRWDKWIAPVRGVTRQARAVAVGVIGKWVRSWAGVDGFGDDPRHRSLDTLAMLVLQPQPDVEDCLTRASPSLLPVPVCPNMRSAFGVDPLGYTRDTRVFHPFLGFALALRVQPSGRRMDWWTDRQCGSAYLQGYPSWVGGNTSSSPDVSHIASPEQGSAVYTSRFTQVWPHESLRFWPSANVHMLSTSERSFDTFDRHEINQE